MLAIQGVFEVKLIPKRGIEETSPRFIPAFETWACEWPAREQERTCLPVRSEQDVSMQPVGRRDAHPLAAAAPEVSHGCKFT